MIRILKKILIDNRKKNENEIKNNKIKLKILLLFYIILIINYLPLKFWVNYDIKVQSLEELGEYKFIEDYTQKTYKHLKYWFGENNYYTLWVLSDLASFYKKQKFYDKAYIYYKKGIELRKKYNKLNNSEGINLLKGLSESYLHMHKYQDSIKYAKKALNISNEIYGTDSEGTLLCLINLELIYIFLNNTNKVEEVYESINRLSSKFLKPENIYYTNFLYAISSYYLYIQDYEKLNSLIEKALVNINKKDKYFYYFTKGELIYLLVQSYEKMGYINKAEILHKKRIHITRQIFGENSLSILDANKDLGLFYLRNKNINKSKIYLNNILKKELKYLGEIHPETMCTYYYKGIISKNHQRDYFFSKSITIANKLNKCTNCSIIKIKNICNLNKKENL